MNEVRTEIELGSQTNFDIKFDGCYGQDGFNLSMDSNIDIYGNNHELESLAVEILIFLAGRGRLTSCLKMVFSNIDLDESTIDKLIKIKEE